MPIARNKAGNAATRHAVDNKESQAAMLLQRYIMLLTLDQKEDKDNKTTAAAPEEPIDADVDIDMDTNDTAVDIKASSLPPRVFLRLKGTASDWQMETLTQILGIRSPSEASDTVLGPERAFVNILAQERPQRAPQTPEQAIKDTPSIFSQTSVEVSDQIPSTPCPITRRRDSRNTPTAPQSSGRSVLGTFALPAPSSASAGVPPWSVVSSPSLSLAVIVPENDDTSSASVDLSRRLYPALDRSQAMSSRLPYKNTGCWRPIGHGRMPHADNSWFVSLETDVLRLLVSFFILIR